MTRRQRKNLVHARAELILAGDLAVQAYAIHFEAQMRRGQVRKLLRSSYVQLVRIGKVLFDPGSGEFADPLGGWHHLS
jgi:hypothetical protein